MKEKKGFSINGFGMFVALLLVAAFIVSQVLAQHASAILFIAIASAVFILTGFFMV